MPAVDYRSVRGFWGPVRLPRWAEILLFSVLAVLLGLLFGTVLWAAFACGRAYSQLWVAGKILALRLTMNLLFVPLSLVTLEAYRELFLARDLQFLFSLPLSDREVFKLKVRRLAAVRLPGWGFLSIVAIAIALGARSGWSGVVAAPVAIGAVLFIAMMISLLAAFSRPLRWIIYATNWTLLGLPFVIPFAIRLDRAMNERLFLFVAKQSAFFPASWIADLVRSFPGWPGSRTIIHSIVAVAVLCVIGLVIHVVSRRAYTQSRVLGQQEATYALQEKKTSLRGSSREWSDWPLARWINGRTTRRSHSLLRFITRSEQPMLVDRDAVLFIRNNVLALAASFLARPIADALGDPVLGVLVTIVFFVFAWFAAWFQIDMFSNGLAQALRVQSRGQRQSVFALPSAARPMDRGDHRHPLIETWPIDIVEFTKTFFWYLMVRYLAAVLLALPFVCLAVIPEFTPVFVILAILPVMPFLFFQFACSHGLAYQRHPRRSHLRDLAVVLAITVGVLVIVLPIVLVIVAPIGSWSVVTHNEQWMIAGIVLVFGVSFLVGAPLTYWRLLRTHERRWFDAEYQVRRAGGGY